jgi:hypothetical protein
VAPDPEPAAEAATETEETPAGEAPADEKNEENA